MQLSVRQVAKLLKVSESKIKEWIRRGILRAERVNDQYRLHRSDLLERTASREINVRAEIFLADPAGAPTSSLVGALRNGGIVHDLHGADRPSVVRAIVDTLALPADADRESIAQILLAREALGSTAIGEGIAIPHVRRPLLFNNQSAASITLCFLKHPVDFGAPDGEPVFAVFLLLTPTARTHLQLLSRLSFALHDAGLKAALARRAAGPEILAEFQRVEAAIRAREELAEPES